jgi:hypothetical protein
MKVHMFTPLTQGRRERILERMITKIGEANNVHS